MKRFLSVLAVAAWVLLGTGGRVFAQNAINDDLDKVGTTTGVSVFRYSSMSTLIGACSVTVTKMPSGSNPGHLTVTGYKNYTGGDTDLYVAAYITDKSGRKFIVTKIGDNAFAGNTNITSVYMYYYGNTWFTTEKNFGGVKMVLNQPFEIGSGAFSGCTALKVLTFNNSDGTNYVNCSTIGANAFKNCLKLGSCRILATLGGTIGENAFANCSSLTGALHVSGSVDDNAFTGCTGITSIYWYGGYTGSIWGNGYSPFYPMHGSVTTVNLYGAVPEYMFSGFDALTEVKTPADVWDRLMNTNLYKMGIGKEAFKNCKKLTTISVAGQIDPSAFTGCTALRDVTYRGAFLAQSQVPEYTFQGFFYDCKDYITSFTVATTSTENTPNTYIPSFLCCGMKNLTQVTIPDYVHSVGSYAFANCTGLVSVRFNKNTSACTLVGDEAFAGCSQLTNIILPVATEYIYKEAFRDCKELVTFPVSADNTSLKTIGEGAFANTGISEAYIPAGVTTVGENPFSNSKNLVTIDWNPASYTKANPLGNIKSQLTAISFGKDVTYIPAQFANGSKISELELSGIKTIGEQAFANAAGLKTVTIYQTVPSIAANSFEGTDVQAVYTSCTVSDKLLDNAAWKAVCANIQTLDNTYSYPDNMDDFWSQNATLEIVEPINCEGVFVVRAIPTEGASFLYWNDGNTDNPRTVDMKEFEGWFLYAVAASESDYHRTNFTVTPEGAGILKITNQYGKDCSNQKFLNGDYVRITPVELNGWYRFDKWDYTTPEGGEQPYVCDEYSDPNTLCLNIMYMADPMGGMDCMDEWGNPMPCGDMSEPEEKARFDENMKARFVLKDIPVSFVSCTDGNGYADLEEGFMTVGSEITLVAKPKEGYVFDKWEDGDTQATRKLTITPELLTELRPMGMDPELGEMTYNEVPVDMGGGSLEHYNSDSEYTLSLCAYFKKIQDGIEDVVKDRKAGKVLLNGVLYIITGDKTYNVLGEEVR